MGYVYSPGLDCRPKVVKEAVAKGLDVKGRGRWFFVPSPPPQGDSWPIEKYIERFNPPYFSGDTRKPFTYEYGMLYVDYGHSPTPQKASEIVYRANSMHYVRGVVQSPGEPDLELEDWHRTYLALTRVRPQTEPTEGDRMERQIEAYLVLNWQTGEIRVRKTGGFEVSGYEIPVKLNITLRIPDPREFVFKGEINLSPAQVSNIVLEELSR